MFVPLVTVKEELVPIMPFAVGGYFAPSATTFHLRWPAKFAQTG